MNGTPNLWHRRTVVSHNFRVWNQTISEPRVSLGETGAERDKNTWSSCSPCGITFILSKIKEKLSIGGEWGRNNAGRGISVTSNCK